MALETAISGLAGLYDQLVTDLIILVIDPKEQRRILAK